MLDFGYVTLDGSPPDISALADASILSFDTETSGTNVARDFPWGFSLASNPNSAYYTTMHNRCFTDLLADEEVLKVAHNAKFDRSMFKKRGVTVDNLCCTMVAAHLLEENRLNLKDLLKRYIRGHDLNIKFFEDYDKLIQYSTLQEMANHFGPHSAAALALWNVLQRQLRVEGLWNVFWNVEMPVLPVLSDMEMNGSLIDVPYLDELGKYYDDKCEILKEGLTHYSNHPSMNWNSSDQVAHYMYKELGVPVPIDKHGKVIVEVDKADDDLMGGTHTHPEKPKKKKLKHPSVGRKFLEVHREKYSVINVYLAWKSYRHLKDSFVNGILKRLVDGRIHTNFNQTRTRTGRLSSSDPNLQNIPMRTEEGRKIRRAFIAPEGFSIVKADMDQVELKKMACLSNCTPMLEAFRNGEDIHKATAIRAYNDEKRRFDGKTLNFKLVYGGGTPEEQKILFAIYPEIKKWTDSMGHDFEVMGFARTHHGRKRSLGNFEHMSRKDIAHACREGISTMDQGSCSEYLKISMYKVWKQIRDSDIRMLLQVHDELVFECPNKDLPEFVPFVKEAMRYNGLQIPLTATVTVGRSWAETEKLEAK